MIMLQTKRVVTAQSIAERFEISTRTVYRDIRALEEGGIPIGAEAGVGYYLLEGYHLPPVMFTHEEARTILLASKLIEKTTDKAVSSSFNSALTKVRSVLDAEKKDEIEYLEDKIIVHPYPDSPQKEVSSNHLDSIKTALAQNRILSFEYFSNYKAEFSSRRVEGVGIIYYSNHWHLIAFCQSRQAYRDFRLDRISKLTINSDCYKPYVHLSLEEYINDLVSNTELTNVKLKVQNEALPFITNIKYSMGLVKEENHSDFSELTFTTFSVEYFSRWVLSFLDKVEVLYPEEVKSTVSDFSQKLYNHHSKI